MAAPGLAHGGELHLAAHLAEFHRSVATGRGSTQGGFGLGAGFGEPKISEVLAVNKDLDMFLKWIWISTTEPREAKA